MSLISSIQGLGQNFFSGPQAAREAANLRKMRELQPLEKPEQLRALERTNQSLGTSGATGAPTFGEMVENLVKSVDAKQKVAKAEGMRLMSGESDNLHQAMIASQEAGVAFSMMVEMRNKVVEAYKELSRMQV